MNRSTSTRVARAPSERLRNARASQDSKDTQNEGNSRPAANTGLSRTSATKTLDATEPMTSNPKPGNKPGSPTKLPVGSHQRSASVKQLSTTPSLKPTGLHQRQASLNKTSLLRRPSDARAVPTSTSRPTDSETRSAQNILQKRQISPSRMPQTASENRIKKGPAVATRSSSIATKKALGTQNEASSDKKARSVITPPSTDRPTFSAHQQHFSPLKPKPAAGTDPTTETGPPQYTRESLEPTLELLHLHSIHRDSARVQQEWQQSAKLSYGKQFSTLQTFNLNLNEREKDMIEQTNAAAIMAWGNQEGGATIERKIQVLSSVIREAYEVTENNGKYTMAVQAFEHWYENAQAIHRRRLDKRANATHRVDVIEGLGDGWKAEIASLQVRALQVSNDVLSLGDVQMQSDLSRCVTTLSEMLMNMLEELEMMQSIEQSMVEQEQFWVQSSVDRMASDLRVALPD